MAAHLFEGFVALLRRDDLYHLDLVELVLANHAAGITAIGTGFTAEARGMGGELERQTAGVDDLVAHHVGQRHFGGRDQEEITIVVELEQVFLELGQLAGAHQGVAVDDIGYVIFFVAMLQRLLVEHELHQRTVQARDGAMHHGEA